MALAIQQFGSTRRRQRRFWLGAALLISAVGVLLAGLYVATVIANGVESTSAESLASAASSSEAAARTGDAWRQSVAAAALVFAQNEVQKQQAFAAVAVTIIAAMTGIIVAIFVWASTLLFSAAREREADWQRAATALAIAQDLKLPIEHRVAQWVEFKHAMARLDPKSILDVPASKARRWRR